jgi:hypothetical protein
MHPDQTTLCDFVYFSCCFYAYIVGFYQASLVRNQTILPDPPPLEPSDDDAGAAANTAALAAMVQKLVMRVAKCLRTHRHLLPAKSPNRAVLYVHQLPAYVSIINSPGRTYSPYVIDYLQPEGPNPQVAVRIGQLYPRQPSGLQLLRAVLEHVLTVGGAALPTVLVLPRAEDALAVAPLLAPLASLQHVLVTVSEMLDQELFRALYDDKSIPEAVSLSTTAAGTVVQPVSHWQWHTESFQAKGNTLDPVYLRDWYAAATEFYNQRAWLALSDKVTIDIAVNGIGRNTVVMTGADGSPPTLHLFKSSKPVDMSENHWMLMFTSRNHVPFVDQDMVGKIHPIVLSFVVSVSHFCGCRWKGLHFRTLKMPPHSRFCSKTTRLISVSPTKTWKCFVLALKFCPVWFRSWDWRRPLRRLHQSTI